MTRDQRSACLQRLVVLLGVQLDILARQIGEGAGQALRLPLGRRVFALHDVEHHPRRQPPGVGQANRAGIAEVQPARPAGADR